MRRQANHAVRASRTGLIGALALLSVMGFVVYQSMLAGSATCEVCITYRGRSQCRAVSAASTDEATTSAVVNACAYLSGGVTDSMACQRTTPTSITCD